MADLSISITLSDADATRMLEAFRRRTKNPELTQDQMLAVLKASAIDQIKNVILNEERAAIEEQKNAVTAPDIV